MWILFRGCSHIMSAVRGGGGVRRGLAKDQNKADFFGTHPLYMHEFLRKLFEGLGRSIQVKFTGMPPL